MIANQLNAILDVLAKRLGTTVHLLWSVMIRQEIVNGIENLIWVLFGTALLVTGAILLKKLARWVSGNNYNDDEMGGAAVFGFAVTVSAIIGGVILIIVCTQNALAHFVNPAYFALSDMTSMLTGKSN